MDGGSCTKLLSSTLAGNLLNCPALPTARGSMESQRANMRHLMRLKHGLPFNLHQFKVRQDVSLLGRSKADLCQSKAAQTEKERSKETPEFLICSAVRIRPGTACLLVECLMGWFSACYFASRPLHFSLGWNKQ